MAAIQNDTLTDSDKPENLELNSDEPISDKKNSTDNKKESIISHEDSKPKEQLEKTLDIKNKETKNNENQPKDDSTLKIIEKKENSKKLVENKINIEILEDKDTKNTTLEETQKPLLQSKDSKQTSNDTPISQNSDQIIPPAKLSPQSSSQPNSQNNEKISFYNVKWVEYNQQKLPIVTQNENGSCPLLAIINFLLLQQKISLNPSKDIVESPELTTLLANYILEHVLSRVEPELQENLEQQVNDAISMIPSLVTGLDVNIRFTGIRDFEYTSDIEIFNLLGIPLFHGWLIDPELVAVRYAIRDNSYNQLVVKIVQQQSSEDENLLQEALIAEEFLNSTASQLTYHGLCELSSALNNQDMGVLFRNNHFLTIVKHSNSLYVLATDQGFLNESGVVWESLSNIEGDSHFCDSNFKVFRPHSDSVPNKNVTASTSTHQIDSDYLMALTLQQDEGTDSLQMPTMTDEELARRLELEEKQLNAKETVTEKESNDYRTATKKSKSQSNVASRASTSNTTPTSSSSSSVLKEIKENCVMM